MVSSSPPLTWRLMLAHQGVRSGDSGLWHRVNQGICLCNGNGKRSFQREAGAAKLLFHHTQNQIKLITRVLCSCSLHFQGMFVTHKHHVHYLSASECKPYTQPCGSPSAHLSVQPHAPSGTGSSSSLSPASIAEDVFFNSTNEDQVKLYILDLNHFYFQFFSVLL